MGTRRTRETKRGLFRPFVPSHRSICVLDETKKQKNKSTRTITTFLGRLATGGWEREGSHDGRSSSRIDPCIVWWGFPFRNLSERKGESDGDGKGFVSERGSIVGRMSNLFLPFLSTSRAVRLDGTRISDEDSLSLCVCAWDDRMPMGSEASAWELLACVILLAAFLFLYTVLVIEPWLRKR